MPAPNTCTSSLKEDDNGMQLEMERDPEKLKKNGLNYTVSDLLSRAESCREALEYVAAIAFLERARAIEPLNVNILEAIGEVCMEEAERTGNYEFAEKSKKVTQYYTQP